jgi:hypothetical protein
MLAKVLTVPTSTLFANDPTGIAELLELLPQRASVSAILRRTAVRKGVDLRVHKRTSGRSHMTRDITNDWLGTFLETAACKMSVASPSQPPGPKSSDGAPIIHGLSSPEGSLSLSFDESTDP